MKQQTISSDISQTFTKINLRNFKLVFSLIDCFLTTNVVVNLVKELKFIIKYFSY